MTRTDFDTRLDSGGLADNYALLLMLDGWRTRTSRLTPRLPDEVQAMLATQGYPAAETAWALWAWWGQQPPATRMGWRAWYLEDTRAGATRAEWQALPDGIVLVMVDVPGATPPDIRRWAWGIGEGRALLEATDPYWWDDTRGHPRDSTEGRPGPEIPPEDVKQGRWVANPVMGAVRLAAIATGSWENAAVPWPEAGGSWPLLP